MQELRLEERAGVTVRGALRILRLDYGMRTMATGRNLVLLSSREAKATLVPFILAMISYIPLNVIEIVHD